MRLRAPNEESIWWKMQKNALRRSSGRDSRAPARTEQDFFHYTESFKDEAHLNAMVSEAQEIVNKALAGSPELKVIHQSFE
jgi:hypothetical protein